MFFAPAHISRQVSVPSLATCWATFEYSKVSLISFCVKSKISMQTSKADAVVQKQTFIRKSKGDCVPFCLALLYAPVIIHFQTRIPESCLLHRVDCNKPIQAEPSQAIHEKWLNATLYYMHCCTVTRAHQMCWNYKRIH